MHSTNYTNTFIEVAADCKSDMGKVPPEKQAKTIARMQYELLHEQPYHYTSDEVIFACYAAKNGLESADLAAKRAAFFAKGQPCLRASPLGKTYGWGIHFDHEGKVAIYGCDTVDYVRLQNDPTITHLKAMKSAR